MSAEVDIYQDRGPVRAEPFMPVTVAHPAAGGSFGTDIDSWTFVVSDVIKLANVICETQFVPKVYRGNGPATAAAILAGRELGLPPMTSLRHVQVVEGSPSLSAEYKRARVLAAGHEFDILELSITRCRVAGRRRGSGKPPLEILFTIEDAKRAGLVKSRGAWETRPRRMLFARAGTELCDFLFADVTNGLPTTELRAEGDGEDEFAGYNESPGQAAPSNGHAEPAKPAARTAQRRQRAAERPAPTSAGGAAAATPAADSVTPQTAPAEPGLPPLPGEEEATESDAPATESDARAAPGWVGLIVKHFERLGVEDRGVRLGYTAQIAGLDALASTKDLTPDQAKAVLDTLARCKDQERLIVLLDKRERDAQAGGSDG